MRNHFLNVLTVRSCKASERNILIPHLDLATLAEQAFDQLHLWALAQIVRAGFEAQSKHCDLAFAGSEHCINRTIHMPGVARHQRFEHRKLKVQLFSAISNRAKVFGKARATEREPRCEVCG